jgi:diacylglycerol kinase family enzyme
MAKDPSRATALERLAALVALGALAACGLLLAVGAVGSLTAILLTIAGLLVLVMAGWNWVTHHGQARIAAGLSGLLGLAILIVGFVTADLNALRIAVVVALAIVSIVTARIALHRNAKRLQSEASSRLPASPPSRPVLIMNPKSGGGKVERFQLASECRRRGIQGIELGPNDDLVQVAEEAVVGGADVIGMAGGDGSQALVAAVAARNRIPHVVVPAGTRNHFALDLGLDRDDVVGALDAYVDGVDRQVDLATVNGRVFVNNASLGIYAKIVQSSEYRNAKMQTAMNMLPNLIGSNATPLDLRFRGPDGAEYPTANVIMISNNPYELHRFAGHGTRERLDLGVLGIAIATIRDAEEAARFVALEAVGQVQHFPGWLEWTTTTFEITSSGDVDVGVDGEALRLEPPIVFKIFPGALQVRIPRRAIGKSPSARAVHLLSRSVVAQLIRVSEGHPLHLTEDDSRSKGNDAED